jgi:type II secretory pathway component PulC
MVSVVALTACGSPPPPADASERQFAQTRAAHARLAERVAALEARMKQVEAPANGSVAVVVQPDAQPEASAAGPVLVSEHHYRVPRKFFDEMLEDPDATMREVRVVPVTSGNRVTGLRLFGLRPKTRLAALGFQNGDQLESLNGEPLTTPEQALSAYAAARNADDLRVKLLRRGQSIVLRYDLVD